MAPERSALLIDWGGVLTTNLFASFHDYCLKAEIDPKLLLGRFRTDPEARKLLVALETGELDEAAFEKRFAPMLEVEPDGLIDGLFAGVEPDARDGPRGAAGPERRHPHRRWSRTPGACTATRTTCSTNCSTASSSPAEEGIRKPRCGCTSSAPSGPGSSRRTSCSSTTCPSTSRRPRSSAWRPSTTRAPRQTIPELERAAWAGSRCARARRGQPSAAATPREQLDPVPPGVLGVEAPQRQRLVPLDRAPAAASRSASESSSRPARAAPVRLARGRELPLDADVQLRAPRRTTRRRGARPRLSISAARAAR